MKIRIGFPRLACIFMNVPIKVWFELRGACLLEAATGHGLLLQSDRLPSSLEEIARPKPAAACAATDHTFRRRRIPTSAPPIVLRSSWQVPHENPLFEIRKAPPISRLLRTNVAVHFRNLFQNRISTFGGLEHLRRLPAAELSQRLIHPPDHCSLLPEESINLDQYPEFGNKIGRNNFKLKDILAFLRA